MHSSVTTRTVATIVIVAEVVATEVILMVVIVGVVILGVMETTIEVVTIPTVTITIIVVDREVDQEVFGVDQEVEDDTMVSGVTTATGLITLPKIVRFRETEWDVAMP